MTHQLLGQVMLGVYHHSSLEGLRRCIFSGGRVVQELRNTTIVQWANGFTVRINHHGDNWMFVVGSH